MPNLSLKGHADDKRMRGRSMAELEESAKYQKEAAKYREIGVPHWKKKRVLYYNSNMVIREGITDNVASAQRCHCCVTSCMFYLIFKFYF